MRGKYERKRQRKKALQQPNLTAVATSTNQESPTEKERTGKRDSEKQPPMRIFKPFIYLTQRIKSLAALLKRTFNYKIVLETTAVFAGLAVLVVYAWQLYVMQRQLRLDQRAWVGFVLPERFPLEGTSIPATIQITSFGKTPARQVEANMIATVYKKGEQPNFNLGIGQAHNRVYTGVVFPNAPFPITIQVKKYNPFPPAEIISPADLSKELAAGTSYIIFLGEIKYLDIFGKPHWTHFCTGTGIAMATELDILKKCTTYNDVDHDE